MRRSPPLSLRTWLLGLGIFCLAASAHAQPPGFPFDPTHYWSYQIINPVPQPQPIFAADQFFRTGVPLTVERRERPQGRPWLSTFVTSGASTPSSRRRCSSCARRA